LADFLDVPVLDCAGEPAADARPMPNDAEPMPYETWTVQSPTITEPRPDVLLIRPRRFAFLGGVQVLSVLFSFLVLSQVWGGGFGWLMWTPLAVLLCIYLLVPNMLGKARFDRGQGLLTLRLRGRRSCRPLESIKAVEVKESPFHELNLLTDNPCQARLNLMLLGDADAALVRRAADQVASFLEVPLLDARGQPREAAPTSGEGLINPLEALNRSPLAPGSATVRGQVCLVPKGDDVLLLRPRSGFSWVWLVPALISLGAEVYLIWMALLGPAGGQGGQGDQRVWLLIVLLGVLGQFSAFLKPLLLYRDYFDRKAGLLTLGCFGFKGTYPLAKILAVQLVPGGLADKVRNPFGRAEDRVCYQLNLVIADAYEDRLNLTNDSELEWTRQAGQQVADFLGVPVIDQIADGG
jgi:hypothetical protein